MVDESVYTSCVTAVFARAPVTGQVKTRLIPALGAERARVLYEAMLEHAVETATRAAIGPTALWCTPNCTHPFLKELSRRFGARLRAQSGDDLGERMHRASALALEDAPGVLIIGSDCPHLDADNLRAAATALATSEVDAVLGPAADGGYYLIGLKRPHPALFSEMPWGEHSVLEYTQARLKQLGMRWHELAVLHDVDRPEDLALLDERFLARH